MQLLASEVCHTCQLQIRKNLQLLRLVANSELTQKRTSELTA